MEVIIGDPDRLRAVAENFIKHYETRVAEGATVQFLKGRFCYI
jgi:type I restriction enzyme R subunit